jgi:hypothetical protein
MSFRSKEDFKQHIQGFDGTPCRAFNNISEQKLKDCILGEVNSLGISSLSLDLTSDNYIDEIRKCIDLY